MPNTGKPSKDCHLCRSRRVKCDLGRPACQRCIKYGAECPGYRNEQELVFHNYTSNSGGPKKRKKRAAKPAGSTTPSVSSSAPPTPSSLGDSGPATPSLAFLDEDQPYLSPEEAQLILANSPSPLFLTKPLHEHWTAQSIPILLNVYESLEFLNKIYQNYPQDGPLVWAAHLFSRTYITNVAHPTSVHKDAQEETEQELRTYMGKALRSVHGALQAPDGALRDDVLATVWILANYELLAGSLNNSKVLSPWHLHSRGLCSILRTRGSKMFFSEAGRVAFWSAYNMVQIEALVTSSECPAESREWLGIIKTMMDQSEHAPLLVSSYIVEIARVQCRMLVILRDHDSQAASAEYSTLMDCLRKAEAEVVANLVIGEAPHSLSLYWVQLWRAAQVKCYHVAHLLATFLTHFPPYPVSLDQLERDRREWLDKVWSASSSILEDTPRFLGAFGGHGGPRPPKALFDALKMIWPLTVIYIIPSSTEEHKAGAHAWLLLVGRELGVRQALKVYPEHAMRGVPDEAREPLRIEEI